MNYSQCGEDLWVAENLKPKRGSFCEVGAFNGIGCSNTLMFEEDGWPGICIEPVPESAFLCFRNRKCHTICCAVGSSSAFLGLFHYNNVDLGASGIADHCATNFTRTIPVPIMRLDDIFDVLCPECPTLLSIDTEGTEVNVLESLGSYRPEIIIIEYKTFDNAPNDHAIKLWASITGYKEVHRTMCNLILTR